MSLQRHGLLAAALMGTILLPGAAAAHFQSIYAETPVLTAPGDVPLRLIFWHPFENGHVMDMGVPTTFYMVHRGEKTDLSDRLSQISFQGAENSAVAYAASVPVKKAGDYVLVLDPAPYYEQTEDIYIEQITKAYLNRAEMPTDWSDAQGLPTEIVPLNKPYAVVTGSTFSGQVLSAGQPVAGAEIEVEYIAALPDMATNTVEAPRAHPLPGGTLTAITDANGTFTFGIPKAGWWGFAALGVGPEKSFEGKELSQDAVIWVYAQDME
ncbi:DUF4198 domain-containing protein [Rhodobacter maris]|uniref:Cobalt/nickel transport protein n=1 Tax=Rhodobacter maris TaxID=446682 RepID=A0A285RZU5_9RHOB|nr:DUF4198 domain-containing protein [Rhodobacter maris]SOB99977.1 cobalt/nickel transport protein [Rhodobacter maris]